MADANDLRRLALALPCALEKPHFDRAAFRVDGRGGKIFVTLAADGKTANLMLSRDEQDVLLATRPDLFMRLPNKWGENGATQIDLSIADEADLRSAVKLAWRQAAPKMLLRASRAGTDNK